MPEIMAHLMPVMDAFMFLSSSRQLGGMGGVGPIPLGEILTYLQWYEVKGHDKQRKWIRMLRALDNAYLKIANKPSST